MGVSKLVPRPTCEVPGACCLLCTSCARGYVSIPEYAYLLLTQYLLNTNPPGADDSLRRYEDYLDSRSYITGGFGLRSDTDLGSDETEE